MSVAAIRASLRRPTLADDVRFATIRTPDRWLAKPLAHSSLDELAGSIHRDRGEAALELADAPLRLLGQDESRPGVSVWTLGEDGQRHRYLGWVWLDGGDRQALQAALFALAPIVAFADAA